MQRLSQAIISFYTIGTSGITGITNTAASNSPPSLFISLHGDLGTGKTTATRYLLKAMGYGGKVKSPTYSLCEEHILQLPNHRELLVFHFDLTACKAPANGKRLGS